MANYRAMNGGSATKRVSPEFRFSGVDYSTQRFSVNQNRAIDLNNYVYINGVIQKRRGIEQLSNVEVYDYYVKNFDDTFDFSTIKKNPTNFNGIWSFKAEDGKRHIIAHIGRLLFEMTKEFTFKPIFFKQIEGGKEYTNAAYEFQNFKSNAYVSNNRLYFLGGNKYMVLRFLPNNEIHFRPVENDIDTYIPTTTISITYNDSIASGRSSLDDLNLLNMWHWNECLSGTGKEEISTSRYFEYQLDQPIICKTKDDYKDIEIIIKERGVIDNGYNN